MKIIAVLTLIFACSVILQAQRKTSVPEHPDKWSLSLKTGGAPWEKKFVVELNQSGNLIVVEEDAVKMPADTTSKLTATLTATEAHEVYEQVLKAFREFRFPKEEVKLADGTNLTLQLSANGRVLVMQFFHIAKTEDESVEVATVLRLINKHLPAEHQVY